VFLAKTGRKLEGAGDGAIPDLQSGVGPEGDPPSARGRRRRRRGR
jgi:hypothetical protein